MSEASPGGDGWGRPLKARGLPGGHAGGPRRSGREAFALGGQAGDGNGASAAVGPGGPFAAEVVLSEICYYTDKKSRLQEERKNRPVDRWPGWAAREGFRVPAWR